MTKEEEAREKKLGYFKYHLSEKFKDKDVNIIWPQKMVVIKDTAGKEKKVAWYNEQWELCTSASAKTVQADVDASMQKWWKKKPRDPDTESE